MPKYFELPDDFDLETLGDAAKAFKSYEPEDVAGLKSKANSILSEKKAAEARAAELEAQLKKMKVGDPEKGSDKLQSQLEDAMAKLKQKDEELGRFQKEVKMSKIHGEAAKIAAALTKDARRAGLLSEKIASRIDIDNGKPIVLDASGNPTVSDLSDLASSIAKEFDFLCDGSQAAGGGASGGSGGAAKTKEIKRSQFDTMSQFDRSKFAKEGGKVVND